MNFKGDISGYGKVFASMKLESRDSSKTSGILSGQARTILNDGTLLSSPINGSWKRSGVTIKFYFIDDVSNGAMNFVVWDADVLTKKVAVRYWEVKSANQDVDEGRKVSTGEKRKAALDYQAASLFILLGQSS